MSSFAAVLWIAGSVYPMLSIAALATAVLYGRLDAQRWRRALREPLTDADRLACLTGEDPRGRDGDLEVV